MNKIVKLMSSSPRLVDDARRIVRFRGTNGTIDRDGESIDPKRWDFDNYMKNPVVQFGHDYSERPVGRTVKIENDGKNVDFYIQFPASEEEAGEEWFKFTDSVYRMVKSGFLNATSVGFRPTVPPKVMPKGDGISSPRRVFVGQELLEISIVPVPSNPDALANAFETGVLKSCDIDSIKRIVRNETKNTENIKWAEDVDSIVEEIEKSEEKNESGEEVEKLVAEIAALRDIVNTLSDKIDSVDSDVKGIGKYISIANLPEMQLKVIKNHIDCALDEINSGKTVKAVGDPEAIDYDGISAEDIVEAILKSE